MLLLKARLACCAGAAHIATRATRGREEPAAQGAQRKGQGEQAPAGERKHLDLWPQGHL